MANPKGNPNIKKYGEKTQFGGSCGCSAVDAAEKSHEEQAKKRAIADDLRRQSTPETIEKANAALLRSVKAGNLKAYEIWRDMMGEKPKERVEHGGSVEVTEHKKVDLSKLTDEELKQLGNMARRIAGEAGE